MRTKLDKLRSIANEDIWRSNQYLRKKLNTSPSYLSNLKRLLIWEGYGILMRWNPTKKRTMVKFRRNEHHVSTEE